jgi:hypothetical protein
MNKLLKLLSEIPDNMQNSVITLFNEGSNNRLGGLAKGINPGDIATVQNLLEAGSGTPTILPVSTVITFPTGLNIMPLQILSGATEFTVTSAAKTIGATTTILVIGNGVNTPTFTGMYGITNSATFDATDGILNYIQFFWDGIACNYNIYKNGAAPFTFNPQSIPSLTWSGLSNVTQDSNNYIVSSGTQGGAIDINPIRGDQPFTIYIDYPIAMANTNASVFLLQNTSFATYAWDSSNNARTGVWHSNGGFVVGTAPPAFVTMSQGTATFPMKLRLTKSTNDMLIHRSTDGGLTWTLYYTHVGVLSGATNMYAKIIHVGTTSNRLLKVQKRV